MSDADYHEYLFRTSGQELCARSWRPINPVGVIIVVHGYAEHGGRYQWAAKQLVNRGFAVYTIDLRGHGKSSGARHMVQFDAYLEDLAAFLGEVRIAEPNKPFFLLGHSLGGVITGLFTIRYKPSISGVIMSSSFLGTDLDVSGLLLQLVILVGRLIPRLPTVFLDARTVSRDPEVVKAYEADSLIGHGRIAAQTLAEIFKAIAEIKSQIGTIELPLLVLHGAADRLASVEGSKKIYAGVGSKDKSIKLYDGMHHELLNEPEKLEVLADIDIWLRNHLTTTMSIP
jgi:acylglycerol lipase